MIVDDDEEIRETLADLLSEEGYDVVEAGDGADALHRLHDGALPSVILLDLMMPKMDGWQFHGELRRDPSLASIPVVVMTAAGQRGTNLADVREVLHKPFNLDVVLEVVSRFC
jgi:CheY-like chemotaxis protein